MKVRLRSGNQLVNQFFAKRNDSYGEGGAARGDYCPMLRKTTDADERRATSDEGLAHVSWICKRLMNSSSSQDGERGANDPPCAPRSNVPASRVALRSPLLFRLFRHDAHLIIHHLQKAATHGKAPLTATIRKPELTSA